MKKSIKLLIAFLACGMVGMSSLKAETATIVSPSNGHLYQEWEEHRTRRIHSTKIPLEITGDIITEDVNNPPVSYEVGWCWLYGEDFLNNTFDPGTLNCSTEEIVSEG